MKIRRQRSVTIVRRSKVIIETGHAAPPLPSGLGGSRLSWWFAVLLLVGIGAPGCGDLIPPRPPIGPSESAKATLPESSEGPSSAGQGEALAESAPNPFTEDWSDWYVFRLGSRVVGISEIRAESVIDAASLASGESKVRYTKRERLVFRNGAAQFLRRGSSRSEESASGVLSTFQSESFTGPVVSKSNGRRAGKRLTVQSVVDGESAQSTLEWTDQTRGPFALEQSLINNPMEKGEVRRFDCILPSLNRLGVLELQCSGDASIGLLDGSYQVRSEVEAFWFDSGELVDSIILWTDDQGRIERTLRPNLRLESLRCDRATAERLFPGQDESRVTLYVRGTETGRDPTTPRRFTVKDTFQPADGEASEGDSMSALVPPEIANQSVRTVDGTSEVFVAGAVDRERSGEVSAGSPDSAAETQPTSLVDCDAAPFVALASAAAELPPQERIRSLASAARNRLTLSPQGEPRPASLVYRSRTGGYFDHALIVSAALRAAGIPARVVFGLATPDGTDPPPEQPELQLMTLTAWVVAFQGDGWIAIDPISGELDRTDRLCLTLPAADADFAEAQVQLFQRLGTLQIRIGSSDESDSN